MHFVLCHLLFHNSLNFSYLGIHSIPCVFWYALHCALPLSPQIPYLNLNVCNAGTGSLTDIDWDWETCNFICFQFKVDYCSVSKKCSFPYFFLYIFCKLHFYVRLCWRFTYWGMAVAFIHLYISHTSWWPSKERTLRYFMEMWNWKPCKCLN